MLATASVAAAVIAVASLDRTAATTRPVVAQRASASPSKPPEPSGDAARARTAFAIFHNSPADVPRELAKVIRVLRLRNPLDSRFTRVVTLPDRSFAYAVSGATSICFGWLSPTGIGSSGCTSTQADLDKLSTGHLGGSITKLHGGYRVTAFVPDGTANARVRFGSTTRRLPIVRNFVSATVPRRPRSLTWTAPDGTVTGSPALDVYFAG
jgi:hypothetical protein